MIPRLSIRNPPMIRINRITVVKPSTAVPMIYRTSVWIASTTLKNMDIIPMIVTSCNGRVLKDVALVMAYFIRLQKDHLLCPYCLSCTSYSTVSV